MTKFNQLIALVATTLYLQCASDDNNASTTINCDQVLQDLNVARDAFNEDMNEPACTSYRNLLSVYSNNCISSVELQEELQNLNCSQIN